MSEETRRVRLKMGDPEIEVEGDEEFINQKLAYFETKILEWGVPQGLAERGAVTDKPPEESPLEFYKRANPRSHTETVVLFGYYLKTGRHIAPVGVGDVRQMYEEAGISKPARVRDIMTAATDQGYFRKTGRNRYLLTNKGDNLGRALIERG